MTALAAAAPSALAEPHERVDEVDAARGLMMALMALGHARWFLFGYAPDPMDLAQTWPSLFAMRWLTNVAAPGFLLLSGIAVFLRVGRRGRAEVARFLLVRGALLIVLELTVVRFGWIPDPTATVFILQVIWAIGVSLMLLAGLLWLPSAAVGALGAGLVLFHHDLAAKLAIPPGVASALLTGAEPLAWPFGLTADVVYPVLPWAGAMFLGYGVGAVFLRPRDERTAILALSAGTGLAVFLVLRALTPWGDPQPFVPQEGVADAVMAFLRVEKYPPSALYLIATLSLVALTLAAFARWPGTGRASALATIGRAPLFFYVLHLYALHAFGIAMAGVVFGFAALGPPPAPSTPQWPLWAVLVVWAAAMVLLYRPTRWFAGLKARGRARVFGL